MSQTNSDRNLLFGVFALDKGLVESQVLLDALDSGFSDSSQSLGELLVERKAIEAEDRERVESLVAQHLSRCGDSAEQSLAEFGWLDAAGTSLVGLADVDLKSALARVVAKGSMAPTADLPARGNTSRAFGRRSQAESRFTIVKPHARGGLGEVFLAEDEELHRPVALKQIQSRHADNPSSRSRFLIEAEVTARLEHPGIVPVYALGDDAEGRPYYAMRFVHGDTLQEAIRDFFAKGPDFSSLEFRKLLSRFLAVCQAIDYAHSQGVVHRDLKPQNVMLGQYGETLVVDWGLAKTLNQSGAGGSAENAETKKTNGEQDSPPLEPPLPLRDLADSDRTRMGDALGTPAYMSPEQAQGRVDLIGPATDVFGLGATLYSLLTGRPPIEGKQQELLLSRAARGEFAPLRQLQPGVPKPLDAVCCKAMVLDPAGRYPTARALAEDVERWLADEPVTAHPESRLERTWRWFRRRRAWTIAAAAALLLTTAVSLAAALLIESARSATTTALKSETTARYRETAAKDQAKQAIDRYVEVVQSSELLKDGRFQPLRKQLLADAVSYYQDAAQNYRDDKSHRQQLANALVEAAMINTKTGSSAEAMRAYQEAAAILRELADETPASAFLRLQLSICYNDMGTIQWDMGDLKTALANCRLALELRKKLAEQEPTPFYRRMLIMSYLNVGLGQEKMGKPLAALEMYNHAIPMAVELLKSDLQDRDDRRLRESLANLYNNRGNIENSLGDFQAAEQSYESIASVIEPCLEKNPQDAALRDCLTRMHVNLSNLLANQGRQAEGLASAEKAVALAQAVADENPNAITSREMLSSSYRLRARLRLALGDAGAAEFDDQQSLKIAERLAAEEPSFVDYQRDRAETHARLANRLWQKDDRPQAAEHFRSSIAALEKLVEQHPGAVDYRRTLSERYDQLGSLLQAMNEHEAALENRQRAVAVGQDVAQSEEAVDDDRARLARFYHNLGWLLQVMKRLDQAQQATLAAIEIYERLFAEGSAAEPYRISFADSLNNMGYIEADSDRKAVAVDWFARAQQTLDKLVAAEGPKSPAAQRMFNASWGRAQSLADLDRHAESIADWRRTLELDDGSSRTTLRTALAASLVRSDEPKLAAAEALAVCQAGEIPAKTQYDLALTLALASIALKDDAELAGQCITKSVSLFRGLREAGFFNSRENAEKLRLDAAEFGTREELIRLIEEIGVTLNANPEGSKN